VQQTVQTEVQQAQADLSSEWSGHSGSASSSEVSIAPPPSYRHPKKNWRLKRGAVPQWYKQRNGVRAKAQSGAARVARHRPPRVYP